ncbi:hypothetical protein B0J11DRAFT_505985 [Dendryphion nanum]|uniref:Uncharacterized protein n=1 Tax=Dendryphion nanum TaxID=256645 RepID=A0A9P9ILT3_9PLEO|nr:hypothetical protein B0J11DRAFT_505985 [Dendryphion nanum]
MPSSYLQPLTTLLTVAILPSQISSAPQTSTSLPTTEISPVSTHDQSTCHNSTDPSIRGPDQSFLSTTTFGVLSVIIAFGSLIVAIVGVMQYRQFKRKREAASSQITPASAADAYTIPMYDLQAGITQHHSSGSSAYPPIPTQPYVVPSTPPSPVPLPSEFPGGETTAIATSSTTLVPMVTTVAVVDENGTTEEIPAMAEQTSKRPVHRLRFRNSSKFAKTGDVGFGGCYRTFTY